MTASRARGGRSFAVPAAPPALRPGSLIALVAPSGPFGREGFERGVARLRERYRVHFGDDIFERRGYLAGDDARRLAELRAALRDPEVGAVIAARGGYGASRLLDRLPGAEIAAARKLLVGFSDVSALHAAWLRAGVRCIHGPMVGALGRAGASLYRRWIAAVEGAAPTPLAGLQAISGGSAAGPLVGGNLAVLAALAGTPYAPPLDGCVLFLEDVRERPYRIDRMLTHLRHAGWFGRVAGVVLGAFTESTPGEDGVEAERVLEECLGTLGLPVLAGVPAGHLDDNLELPLGAPVRMDADRGTLEFLEPAVVGETSRPR